MIRKSPPRSKYRKPIAYAVGVLAIFFIVLHVVSSAPGTPSNSTPSNSSTDVSTTPTLTSAAFSSSNDHNSNSGGILDYVGTNHLTGVNLESADLQTSVVAGGVSAKSFSLDGSNEDFEIASPSFASTTTNQSISLWVRPKTIFSADGNITLVSYGGADVTNFGNFTIRLRRRNASFSGVTRFEFSTVRDGSTTTNAAMGSTNVAANTWYHVVATTDGSTIKLYVNNNLETLTYYSGSNTGDWLGDITPTAPTKFTFGTNYRDGAYAAYADVYIDEISYWNTLLDASDVSSLYNSGTPNDPRNHADAASLVSYWPLETTTHSASQWQITTTSGNYTSPVYDSGTDTSHLTSITVSPALSFGTTYYWHVRHKDSAGNWSSYSTETSFTTVSGPTLSYDGGTFSESRLNTGGISNSLTASLSGDTFTNAGGTLTGGGTHYTASNVPAGLTVSVAINGGGTTATISLTGSATAHANADDISNLSIVFTNAAFTLGNASNVAGHSKTNIVVDFIDPDSSLFASRAIYDGAIALWDFEETSDPVVDVVNAHNGTSFNTPTRDVSGSVSQAYTFNGTDQEYVALSNDLFDTVTEGALEVVFKMTNTTGIQTLYSSTDSTGGQKSRLLFSIDSGKMRLVLSNSSGTELIRVFGSTTLTAGTWYHAVFQMDETTNGIRMYLNGVAETLSYTTGSSSNRQWFDNVATGTGYNRIAIVQNTALSSPFSGTIDDMVMYSSDKSATVWQEHADLALSGATLTVTHENPGKRSLAEGTGSFVFNIAIAGGVPDDTVTLNFSSSNPLLNFTPSSVDFDTGSEDYDITVSADDNGTPEGLRDVTINIESSSSDNEFDGLTDSFDATLTDAFVVWGLADPHVNTDISSGYSSLETAGLDTLGMTSAGHGFHWDMGIIAGDFTGSSDCADATEYAELVSQFSAIPVDREKFYTVIGNHDSGDNGDTGYFQRYVDPLGEHTAYSNVDPNNMPYPVLSGGAWDHYAFEVGNILFLMLGDRNDAAYPFGKTCGSAFTKIDGSHGINGSYNGRGHPGGTYTKQSYDWWVNEIENNPDKIIVTVAHHQLFETGIRSGMNEGVAEPNSPHGNYGWVDQKGSSFIYALWDTSNNTYSTVDCLDFNQNAIPGCDSDNDGYRDYGFEKYLQDNPGAIDVWLYGHTHDSLTPDSTYNGRSNIEIVNNVLFLNLLAVTRYHAEPVAPFSRVLDFLAGSDELDIRTYRHYTGWSGDVGFYDSAEETFSMSREFTWPGVTITPVDSAATEGGGTASYTVVLDTQPTYGQDVVITPTPDGELSVSPSTLTFDSTNWDTPQTVTVTAVNDTDIEGTHSGTITHSISSGDTQYDALTGLDSVNITITDNDSSTPTASISWAGSFVETSANNGAVSGSITATLSNDTFVNAGGTLTESTHFTIANKPSGLTAVMSVNGGGTVATLTLTGNAVSHLNANDISNLTIVFQNGAFTTTSTASSVTNYSYNSGAVDFSNQPSISWSGSFAETGADDGSVSGAIVANLSGDTFINAGSVLVESTDFTVSNKPSGLTASIAINGGGTMATLTFSGNAGSHADANDVSNLTITFLNGAFTATTLASSVTNYSYSLGTIDFNDNPPPPTPSIFWVGGFVETVANGGAVSGSITATLSNDTFVNAGGTLTESTHFTIANKPSGLTAVMSVNGGGTVATLTFTGSANSHTDANSVSNLSVTFLDGAFTTTALASDVSSYSYILGTIDFVDQPSINWSGSFEEDSANDGSLVGSLIATIGGGDTFVNAGGVLTESTHFTIGNLPTGLTAVMSINGGGTVATLTLTGNAVSHADAQDITNLSVTFLDGAFSSTTSASDISDYQYSSGSIDFDDPEAEEENVEEDPEPTILSSGSAGIASVINKIIPKDSFSNSTVPEIVKKVVLRIGSRGKEVFSLQGILSARGFSLIKDGIFGKITDKFVKQFQKEKNLDPDGVVGPKTWEKLDDGSSEANIKEKIIDDGQTSKSILKKGSRGEDVRALQTLLSQKGLLKAVPNGIFGPATDTAVRLLQKNNQVVVDGIVGPKTWSLLSN